jgi:hypothetical protein
MATGEHPQGARVRESHVQAREFPIQRPVATETAVRVRLSPVAARSR